MNDPLYSVRMHAARDCFHLSGAERLCSFSDVEEVALALLRRAFGHEKGEAEHVSLKVDLVPAGTVQTGRLPDLETITVRNYEEGRQAALALLSAAGVSPGAAGRALDILARGAAPDGRSMRGAMLIDAVSGERLEHDHHRGVRARGMDLSRQAEVRLRTGLNEIGLDNAHVREALVLSAKVLSAPGIVAELCWSDDPSYTAGYVASAEGGYQRLSHLKPAGEERGGRAFFVRPQIELTAVVEHLEQSILLVTEVGRLKGARSWRG